MHEATVTSAAKDWKNVRIGTEAHKMLCACRRKMAAERGRDMNLQDVLDELVTASATPLLRPAR